MKGCRSCRSVVGRGAGEPAAVYAHRGRIGIGCSQSSSLHLGLDDFKAVRGRRPGLAPLDSTRVTYSYTAV